MITGIQLKGQPSVSKKQPSTSKIPQPLSRNEREPESAEFYVLAPYSMHRDVLQLQLCLGLSSLHKDSKCTDVLFIAIDFENLHRFAASFSDPNYKGQLGISIFDTRDEHPALKTYDYSTGTDSNYHCRARNRYLFGRTEEKKQWEFAEILEGFMKRDRNIVIVGHGMYCDLEVLRFLNVDIKSSVVGIFDTAQFASLVLGPG